MKSYITVFRNYGNFSGILNRKDYWSAVLVHWLISILLWVPIAVNLFRPDLLPLSPKTEKCLISFIIFYGLITVIPFWSATVRRLHSLPRCGWWLLLCLIPGIGSIIVLIWLCQAGEYEKVRKKLNELLPGFSRITEPPQKGGIFFVVLIILIAAGVFVNKRFKPQLDNTYREYVQTKAMMRHDLKAVNHTGPAQLHVPEAEEPVSSEVPAEAETEPDAAEAAADPVENHLTDTDPIVAVGNIQIQKYAVTNRAYAGCVEAGNCSEPSEPDWLNYYAEADYEDYPVVNVSRKQAEEYCSAYGYVLPSADQWRAAAAGSDSSDKNISGTDRFTLTGKDSQIGTVPVKMFDSETGPVQMQGNVWEWVDTESEEKDTAYGGAWNAYDASPESIYVVRSGFASDNIGFRCMVPSELPDDSETDESALPDAETEQPTEAENSAVNEVAADNSGDPSEIEADSAVSEEAADNSDVPAEIETEPLSAEESASDEGEDDIPGMVLIPAGSFMMGQPGGEIDEKPVHEVVLDAYRMSRYEVSNAEYASCVSDGACSLPKAAGIIRHADYYGNPDFADYPVTNVDWSQAQTYCEWIGGRLPTEAEWEHAARGTENSKYPWGEVFDSGKLNYAGNAAYDAEPAAGETGDISEFGIHGMAGNVSEWVYDRYAEDWYQNSEKENPMGAEKGGYRSVRGASYATGENFARSTKRYYAKSDSYSQDRGFRCVIPGKK